MCFRRFSLHALGTSFALLAACRPDADRAAAPGGETTATTGRSPASTPARLLWFSGMAPLLLAPGRSPDRSLIALADTSELEPEGSLRDSNATFVRLDGSRTSGRVAITQSAEGCIEAAIEPSPTAGWGVGFVGGSPVSLPVDSIRGLSRQDSTALTRTAFRLASTVPNGAASRFTGLPFVVVDLWRVALPDGAMTLVATLRRQLNQEDSPLEERTFIVAETDSTATDGFALMYSERSSGPEETVESRELLAAVTFPRSPLPELIVAHDFGDQTSYSIIERSARATWMRRWVSRRFSC